MNNVELLAPAGSYESLVAAVNAGADAVYIGGKKFSARAYADNPEEDILIKGIEYAHTFGVNVYMTVTSRPDRSRPCRNLCLICALSHAIWSF